MNELEDIKLKTLLREMKLEKPNPNFSVRVMEKIFDENPALERIKSEKVLGKGFWIISILFVALLAVIFVVSNSGVQTESQINNLLPELNGGLSAGYQSFLEKN